MKIKSVPLREKSKKEEEKVSHSVHSCSSALTLEARRTDDECLLERVRPGSAELRSPRLQGHAPLGHGCHGGGGGLVECRLVVKYGDIRTCKGKGGTVGGGGSQVGGLKGRWEPK